MANLALNNDQLYNLDKPIEPGKIVGTGETYANIEAIPTTLKYPGKHIYDKDNEVLYIISSDGTPSPIGSTTAKNTTFTPSGTIIATDVQEAIEEVDDRLLLLEELMIPITNLFDKNSEDLVYGYIISTIGTVTTAAAGAITTGFIELPFKVGGTEYYLQGAGNGTNKHYAFYNESKTFIQRIGYTNGTGLLITLPEAGAHFIRIVLTREGETAFNIDETMFSIGGEEKIYVEFNPVTYDDDDFIFERFKNEKPDYTTIDFAPTFYHKTEKAKTFNLAHLISAKKGFITIRTDNPHPSSMEGYVTKLIALYDKFGFQAMISEHQSSRIYEDGYTHLLDEWRAIQKGGHEISDQTPDDCTDFISIPPGYESIFEEYVEDGIDEIIETETFSRALLTRVHAGVYTDYQIGTNAGYSIANGTNRITGDFTLATLVSASSYLYVDNATGDKIGWVKIKTRTDAYVDVQTVDYRDFTFGSTETLNMYAQGIGATSVWLSEKATYCLLLAGQAWAHYHGFEVPKAWTHPGGYHSRVLNEYMLTAQNKLGIKFSDTYDNQWIHNTYNMYPVSFVGHQWDGTDFELDDGAIAVDDLSTIKTNIANYIALNRHITIATHFRIEDCPGADDEAKANYYLGKLHDFFQWLFENKIKVCGYSHMSDILIGMRGNPAINIVPNLYTDIDEDGSPDGWELSEDITLVTNDGSIEDHDHSLKITGDGQIAAISGLGGAERGLNNFSIDIKGEIGATVSVKFEYSQADTTYTTIGTAVFTLDSASWKRYQIAVATGLSELNIPLVANFLQITFTAGSNEGNDLFISGVLLNK